MKFCPDCELKKPFDEFVKQKNGPGSYCKPCANARLRLRRKNNPEAYAEHKKLTALRHARRQINRYIEFLEKNGYEVKKICQQ